MKKLNEKQKKILNIVVTSLQIAVVLLAVILSAIILANPNVENNEVGKGATKLLPVLTNSMAGDNKDSFNEGDLIIAKTPKNAEELDVGDIVTFKMKIGGVDQLNTHRIISKDITDAGRVWFNTRGDANPDDKVELVFADEVLAVYKYHIKGVGSAIRWLQIPTNFLLVIVLPLIALFIYNIILFVKMMMQAKFSKAQEQQATLAVDEEEIKRKAVEEYLATKNAAQTEEAPEVEVKEEPKAKAEVKEEAKPKAQEPKAKEAPKTATKAAPKTATKAAPKTATKAAPKTATKAAPKTATKAAPKTATKAAPKTTAATKAKTTSTKTTANKDENK